MDGTERRGVEGGAERVLRGESRPFQGGRWMKEYLSKSRAKSEEDEGMDGAAGRRAAQMQRRERERDRGKEGEQARTEGRQGKEGG